MRDENVRAREKFELSLDGRQIASIVVGALVILAVVFVLGLNVGRQISVRQAELTRGGDLDALDRPNAATAAVDGASLTFHDRLTKGRPAPSPEVSASVLATGTATLASTAPSSSTAAPIPTATPTSTPTATSTATPTASASPTPIAKPTATASSASATKTSAADSVRSGAGSGGYTIQVGAAQGRPEAERLAGRFRTWRPRVEPAEVDGKGRWYRVRVGSFASRDEAERIRKDVARATGVTGFVTASR